MLGFPDDNENEIENATATNTPSYINPFKKEIAESTTPPPVPASTAVTQKEVEDSISTEVVDKVTAVLNTGLPEYALECIDKEAQSKYVRSLIGSTLIEFLQQIKESAEESARQKWQKERMDLANKSAESTKAINDYKQKNDELRNRAMSLDRQKSALNERIATLEAKANTAEAEREQYELECKSLMNKLKVSAVNDETLQSLKQENESLQKENADIKAEMEKKATEAAAQILAAKADIAQKEARIAELSVNTTTPVDDAKDAEIEQLKAELESVKANAKTEADALTARVKALSNATIELEETKRKLAEALSENESLKNAPIAPIKAEEMERLQNELAVRDNELASMRSTIQSQNDELYALHEKLNESGDSAKMAELDAERTKLEDKVEKLENELAQKDMQISDLNHTKEEITAVYEQLKKELERNKKHYADREQELHKQIVDLSDQLETANNDIALLKAEKKPARKRQSKPAASNSGISAIDYNSEYTDWLIPTPPSDSIPIVADSNDAEAEEETRSDEKTYHNPNIPEQMELFS